MTNRADIVLHPVRLRIVRAFANGLRLTSQEIAETMPDEPTATLYRHIAKLIDAGVLRVVETRQARGAPERVLALVEETVSFEAEARARWKRTDARRYFLAFVATMLDGVERFLASRSANVLDLRFRFEIAHLDDAEYARFVAKRDALLEEARAHPPRAGRRPYFLAVVGVPEEQRKPAR